MRPAVGDTLFMNRVKKMVSAPKAKKSEAKPLAAMNKPKLAMHKNAKELRKRMLYDMVGLMM